MSLDLSRIDAELDSLGVSELDKARAISLALGFKRPASFSALDAAIDALRAESPARPEVPESPSAEAKAEGGAEEEHEPAIFFEDPGSEPIGLDEPAEPIRAEEPAGHLKEALAEALFDDLGLGEEIAALDDIFGRGDSPFGAELALARSEPQSEGEGGDELYTSYERSIAPPAAIDLEEEEIEIMDLDDLEILEDEELEPLG